MKFCIFTPTPRREELGGFLVANFLTYFPKENMKNIKKKTFVTLKTSEDFTTFSMASKEIYYLELALRATSRKNCLLGVVLPHLPDEIIRAISSQV